MLVRFDYVSRFIVNANHGIVRSTAVPRVIDCRARVLIPQPTEWQRIGNQTDTATILAAPDFVNVVVS
jgi:hypothetical protein